jgi:hypothetical protein
MQSIQMLLLPTIRSIFQTRIYYDPPFEINDRYELARYITPYGNGLNLGSGWLWKYDVSDYEPLLHDTVHLNAGNWQELLDLSFDIIKGTPPRNVHDVKNIWTGDIGWTSNTENELNERQVLIPSDAMNSRLKVRLTGHGSDQGNCAEFLSELLLPLHRQCATLQPTDLENRLPGESIVSARRNMGLSTCELVSGC